MPTFIPRGAIALAIMTTLGWPASAGANDAVAEFYRGKSITLQIGYPSGGGYDIYARHLARHMGRHIPGNPTIVAQNVPGAGSLKVANAIYGSAPRDGTVIGAIGREHVTSGLLGVEGVQFDATKMNWIGNLDSATSLCVAWHTSTIRSMEDVREREMIVGGSGPGSATVTLPTVLQQVLGFKFKVVAGYPGGNDITLALERGEVEGRCAWSYASLKSTQASYIREGKVRILSVSTLKRVPELPDVPSVVEFARTEEQRQILELLLASQTMARPYVAPPALPADRLAALREAFKATTRDAQFLEEGRRQNLEIDPMDWEEMTAAITRLHATPKPVVEAAIKAMSRGGR